MMEDNIRKRMYLYMYDWATLLYRRKWHNIVSQLSFNEKYFLKKEALLFQKLEITQISINSRKDK